jgi:hypothetical protein
VVEKALEMILLIMKECAARERWKEEEEKVQDKDRDPAERKGSCDKPHNNT